MILIVAMILLFQDPAKLNSLLSNSLLFFFKYAEKNLPNFDNNLILELIFIWKFYKVKILVNFVTNLWQ